jgi:hypothetical protein
MMDRSVRCSAKIFCNVPGEGADKTAVTIWHVTGGLICAILAYRVYRLLYPRRPRFDVSAVSEYWLQQQRDTSGDTHR